MSKRNKLSKKQLRKIRERKRTHESKAVRLQAAQPASLSEEKITIFVDERDNGNIVIGLGGTSRLESALSVLSRDEAAQVAKQLLSIGEQEKLLSKPNAVKFSDSDSFKPSSNAEFYTVPMSLLPRACADTDIKAFKSENLEPLYSDAKAKGLVTDSKIGFLAASTEAYDQLPPALQLATLLAFELHKQEDRVYVVVDPDGTGNSKVSFKTPDDMSDVIKSLGDEERNRVLNDAIKSASNANDLIDPVYQDAKDISGNTEDDRRVLKSASFPAEHMREALRREMTRKSPALAAALSLISNGPPTHKEKPKPRTLDNYLFTLDRLRWHTSVETDRLRQEQAALIWAEVSRARLIEIRPELYTTIYHETDVYTTERLCGMTWKPFDEAAQDEILREEADEAFRIVSEVGKNMPFPEKLPFPSVFLSFRNEVSLSNDQVFARVPQRFQSMIPSDATGRLLGYLLTEGPLAIEFYVVDNVKTAAPRSGLSESLFLYEVLYANTNIPGVSGKEANQWIKPFGLHPWILNIIISLINDQKTLIIEHPDSLFRKQWKKNRKLFSVKRRIPPPYYSVVLRDKIIKDMLETTRKRAGIATFQYGHRFDVRRHERVKIVRGQLPLSDRLRKRLQRDPNRRIYTIEDLRADDAERLARRGIQPKRRDEWMAILVSEVHPHQKPKDESLPYIPATRKLPKKRQLSVGDQ